MEQWQWDRDSSRSLANPDLAGSGAEPPLRPQPRGRAPPAVGLMGSSHSIPASKGWSMSPCIEFCLFLMDHHRLSFGNWVFHLEGASLLCLCLLLFVPSRWHLHCSLTARAASHRAHQTSALQNQVIKAGVGFFSFYQRIVPGKSDFHVVAALVCLQAQVSLVHVQ